MLDTIGATVAPPRRDAERIISQPSPAGEVCVEHCAFAETRNEQRVRSQAALLELLSERV
jgi:hypothetical protein